MLNVYGYNKDKVIENILIKSQEERKIFSNEYINTFDIDIIQDIEEKLSGPTKFLFIGLLSKSLTVKSIFLNKAIDENNLECILTIILSNPVNEIKKLNQAYDETYSESIFDILKMNFSNDFIKLLENLMSANNTKKSRHIEDDLILLRSILETKDADPKDIYKIFVNKSFSEINDIYEGYLKSYESDLIILLKDIYKDETLYLIEFLFKISKDKCIYIAETFNRIFKEDNINEFHIVSIISFFENDLNNVSKKYEELFNSKITDSFKSKEKYEILNLMKKVFEYYS